MDPFIALYMTVGALVLAAAAFVAGLCREPDIMQAGIIIAAAWPPIVAGCLLAAPFVGLYYLGRRLGGAA